MTTRTETELVLPLDAAAATLEAVGGKGASLARLAAAGFPVPPGFHVATEAYRRFVAANGLDRAIASALDGIDAADPAALAVAAAAIGDRFAGARLPEEIAGAIASAYAALGGGDEAVAVRSSATAEDLPGLSFAGQQASFLNVRGADALLAAVRNCWASLWTARAIGYRARMGVDASRVAMAVVVQEMALAEAAGVLFTANPATGERGEVVVNAAFGLGEAVVAGTVTPETFVVDRASRATTRRTPARQNEQVVPAEGQGTANRPVSAGSDGRVLAEPVLRDLVELGVHVERLAEGAPQDIEWAVAGGRVWLLQARPITALPPQPLRDVRWEPPIPGTRWIRRQIVEHMPEPLSPLFADLYLGDGMERSIVEMAAALGMADLIDAIGQGPWFTTVNGYAYMRADFRFGWTVAREYVVAAVAGYRQLFRDGVAFWREERLPDYLATISDWRDRDPAALSDDDLLRGVRELALADARYWFGASLAIGAAKLTDDLLARFLRHAGPAGGVSSARLLRGYPSKALEAEADLDAVAALARRSEDVRAAVAVAPAQGLRAVLRAHPGGRPVLDALGRYLDLYGHQIYNLDFAAPTLADDPLPVLVGLKALVERPAPDMAERLARAARERDAEAAEIARSLGPVRRAAFRKVLGWAQRYAPYREDAVFYVGAGWPTLRRLALELGRRLTAAAALDQPDDVFFLESHELAIALADRAVGRPRPDLAERARERRALREARKRLHPPAAVPPDYRYRLGPIDLSGFETQRRNEADAATLSGFAVSPGRVTASASVIRSPAEFERMRPGTILVSPTTTPAWTPLLAQAAGLVTDIGGVLAHGSIVAREYGIPAVMGTGNATERIADGQVVTVDGDAGTVTLGDGSSGQDEQPPGDAAF